MKRRALSIIAATLAIGAAFGCGTTAQERKAIETAEPNEKIGLETPHSEPRITKQDAERKAAEPEK
jgi:hypothetical protein